MLHHKQLVEEMFSLADIKINGSNPWDIHVHDERIFGRLLREKNLALGEAYMDGLWDCKLIDEFIYRLLKADIHNKVKSNVRMLLPYLTALIFNPQSRRRSRRVAEEHYDLGNDLFTSFLDPYNQYSCAYFKDDDDLTAAQIKKLNLICNKIELSPNDHVLDIGCGWGGFSRFAAEYCNCFVTGVSISKEQVHYAEEFCKGFPVRIVQQDYREIRGDFDKIVSIGMFEHVGRKNYETFMRVVHRCLKPDGVFLLQTIGSNLSEVNCDSWITKYIFPNSMLPSVAQIGKAVEGLLVVEDWHNLGPHYDKTLMSWYGNFEQTWPDLEERYGVRFKRMWEYYLLSCAAAFRARHIQVWQIVFTKKRTRQPDCRI